MKRWMVVLVVMGIAAGAQGDVSELAKLAPGQTRMQNALWIENELTARFNTSKQVVVGEVAGPAQITMIHFAMPAVLKLNRDLLLRMYWDGETEPSVDCPLVDFFCDPAGLRDEVNTELVNKRRGYNCYFPMPFRKSAKIVLVYDGAVEPGEPLWQIMPCYSYVMWQTRDSIGADEAYFHASWRQEALLLGKQDFVAMEAEGRGKFVGWNVTIRRPGRAGYPVDGNEKFYIDGEATASIEFQGLEDSFGFSWGFPETQSIFPRTGFFPFLKGACGYRFFVEDAISFDKSLKVAVGFGQREDPMFRREFSKPGSTLQLSSTTYWYQVEPHKPLPAMAPAADRAPGPEVPFWPDKEPVPDVQELKSRGVRMLMLCGRPEKEIFYAEPGYGAKAVSGYTFDGWELPYYHCRAADKTLEIELTVPKETEGKVRMFVIDPDNFQGGRKQMVTVGNVSLGTVENFQKGMWIEALVTAEASKDGKVPIRIENARTTSNAVVSWIEFISK